MSQHDLRRVEELFQAAADLDRLARDAYLHDACGHDAGLRGHVENLLVRLDAGATLSSPLAREREAARGPFPAAVITEGPGAVIDRYKLLQVIGEGGFGVVYMAEQLAPVVRKVALKIIKLGMDTREVVARFEAERQALAMMDHPNIARVLDGGATRSGRPYFVMELVRGVSITDYCDRNELSTPERLALFQDVCHAVQHAHQKGVIHRDLKPSNVLVTLHDGIPVPKVIDFGVAKAMHGRLTEKTLFTRYEQFVGTPAYMSPEQAEMSALDIDTRTDIYALGVLLYELLTGTQPFDTESLQRAGLAEIQRVIREENPPRPSLRISAAGDTAAEIARQRKLDAASLTRRLRGDLDWIVMKALEKERSRRYATAAAFAEDVARHLRNEPVEAGPPGAAYRLRKLLARNRAAVLSALLVVLALCGGIIGISIAKFEADRNADLAAAQTENAVQALDFLVTTLALTDPDVARDPELSVRRLLDDAATHVGDAFADQPWAEVRVRATIGEAYVSLGEMALGEAQLRRVVELVDATTGGGDAVDEGFGAVGYDAGHFYRTLWTLTNACFVQERPDSFAIAKRARNVGLAHVGVRHPALAEALGRMVDEVEGHAWLNTPDAMGGVPALVDQAIDASNAALEPGDDLWAIVADTHLACGYALWYTPHEAFCVRFWRTSLDVRRREFPPDHPATASNMQLLVSILNRRGGAAEAEGLVREAIASLRRTRPAGSVGIAMAESTLGENLAAQGRYDEAETILLAAHRILEAYSDDDRSFVTVESYLRLISLYDQWGRPDEARPYRDAIARLTVRTEYVTQWSIARRAFGPEHADIVATVDAIGARSGAVSYAIAPTAHVAGEGIIDHLDEFEGQLARLAATDPTRGRGLARLLVGWMNALGPDPANRAARRRLAELALTHLEGVPSLGLNRAEAYAVLAETAAAAGDETEAANRAADAWRTLEAGDLDGGMWFEAAARIRVARELLDAGRYREAERVLLPGYQVIRAQLGEGHLDAAATRRLLHRLYTEMRRPDAARPTPNPTIGNEQTRDKERQMPVKPVPDGFHTITPYLVVKGAAGAIDFYTRAFGAVEIYRQPCPHSGRIINAQLRIGDSTLMLNDEFPEMGSGAPTGEGLAAFSIHLFVDDVDTVFAHALEAGATTIMPVGDMFWGDRFGKLRDPFGHEWSVGTRIEDLTPEQIAERAKAAFPVG